MSFIPQVLDESEGRFFDLYSRLLKDRIIMLFSPIDEHVANKIVMQLLVLESESKSKPIYIYISSPGGCVYSLLAILDTMKRIKCQVITVGLGLVASAASVILISGDTRYALPNTRIMLHQPHGSAGGQVTDIEIQTNEFLFLKNKLNKIIQEQSTLSLEEVIKITDRDGYFSSEEALTSGLIDEILGFTKKTKLINKV